MTTSQSTQPQTMTKTVTLGTAAGDVEVRDTYRVEGTRKMGAKGVEWYVGTIIDSTDPRRIGNSGVIAPVK